MYQRTGVTATQGAMLGITPRPVTRRCFEPHSDQRDGDQSAAVIACMWFDAWMSLRPFRGLALSVMRQRGDCDCGEPRRR